MASRTHLVTSESATRALASPLRMEIVQSFATEDQLTVRDLAERLGKPRGSLYYHVRKLVDIGVLVEAEQQLIGKRYESIYELAADRIAVATDSSSATGRAALVKLVWSTLRQTGREFESALESGLIDGTEDAQIGRRQRVWLSEKDFDRVSSLLERLESICARASARPAARESGRLYSLTSYLIPLASEPS